MNKFLPFLFLAVFSQVHAQWISKNPFEQKVFVENKGQYDLKDKAAKETILFGARQDGLQYFFTKNTIYIKYNAFVKRSEVEIEAEMRRLGIKEEKGMEEKEFVFKVVEEFHQMNFVGAGIGTEIESEGQVTQLYNFSPDNKNISAHAYKKIIYKNLYPGIDMEFYFPEDKQGFKYNFILQPGADASQIKMQFPLAEKLKLSDGNLNIKSAFGDFTDHAPVISNQTVNCVFKLAKGIVQFSIGDYDKTKELIIDPWTTSPVFTSGNNAYDVDWDNNGNCYAYGGNSPFQVIKFDPVGAQQWIYSTSFSSGFYYGDFAVDKNSGSVYIVDGFNGSGAQAIKINKSGTQVAIYNGNPLLQEMWRVNFDLCNDKPVIAGGGTSNPSYTGCTLDTNLASANPVNVINSPTGLHDMWGLALDGSGNAYFATAQTQVGSAGYDNYIFKVPNPSLTPITYSIATTYSFVEVASVNYAPGPPNGFNGMATADTNLFTYDSYRLVRYNNITGVQTGSLSINGNSQSTMTYGGLASDGCTNLFLGYNNSVKFYNTSFNLLATFPAAGMVYDVSLGNGRLYSCGAGFVSAMSISLNPCNPCLNGTTGVSTNITQEPSVYPNPSTNNVNIGFAQFQENTKITLYNAMGQKLQSQVTNQKSVSISLQNLPEGIYMIEISAKDKTYTKKIVKANP